MVRSTFVHVSGWKCCLDTPTNQIQNQKKMIQFRRLELGRLCIAIDVTIGFAIWAHFRSECRVQTKPCTSISCIQLQHTKTFFTCVFPIFPSENNEERKMVLSSSSTSSSFQFINNFVCAIRKFYHSHSLEIPFFISLARTRTQETRIEKMKMKFHWETFCGGTSTKQQNNKNLLRKSARQKTMLKCGKWWYNNTFDGLHCIRYVCCW